MQNLQGRVLVYAAENDMQVTFSGLLKEINPRIEAVPFCAAQTVNGAENIFLVGDKMTPQIERLIGLADEGGIKIICLPASPLEVLVNNRKAGDKRAG